MITLTFIEQGNYGVAHLKETQYEDPFEDEVKWLTIRSKAGYMGARFIIYYVKSVLPYLGFVDIKNKIKTALGVRCNLVLYGTKEHVKIFNAHEFDSDVEAFCLETLRG
jgi:hypothetical protein